ncbi:MAG: n-acetylmuramoyl-l-alanine amidase [Verrucomicrobiales bacterium]|nr:n-acetylmuramoyl-l-alanine amidase [Verrucomicrobiales bacterium]
MNADLPSAFPTAAFPTATFLTALLHTSLLVGAGWLFLLIQRKASAARRSLTCRLTMAAALILTTFQVIAAIPFPALSATPSTPAAAASLPQGSGLITGSILTNPAALEPGKNPSSAVPEIARKAGIPHQLNLPATATLTLVTLWLVGALAVLMLWAASLHHRHRLLIGSKPAGDIFQSLPDRAGIPGWALVNDVRLLPGSFTPCVWGIRKTTLALPASATAWPPGKLRLVLAHECAHLLRRDPLWQMIARFFLAIFWFHPLAWNLARRARAADEQAADDRVLTTTTDAPSYAALLVECARQFPLPRTTHATITAMANSASLTNRVEAILSPATDRRTASPRSFLTPAAFLLAIASAVVSQAPAIATAATSSPLPETLTDRNAAGKDNTAPPPEPAPALQPPDNYEPSKLFDPPISPTPESSAKTAPADQTSPADPSIANEGKIAEGSEKTEQITEQEQETASPEPRKPFNWQPVKIGGVEYLSIGQLKDFYHFKNLSEEEAGNWVLRSNNTVVKLKAGSSDLFVNNVKFKLRHPAPASEERPMISRHDLGYILDPAIRPGSLKGYDRVTTVIIDAGHGGMDSGAMGLRGKESTYTLDTALRLQRRLEEAGLKTILTRPDDSFLPLYERAALAAEQADAIFITLHFGHGAPGEKGIQTYYPDAADTEKSDAPEDAERLAYHGVSLGLATAVHANLLYKLRCQDRGIRSARYKLITSRPGTPSIMFEGGNLAHPEEAILIDTEAYRQSLAEAIAGGIHNYIRSRAQ